MMVETFVCAAASWWELMSHELRPVFSLTVFLVNLLVLVVVLYVAGLIVMGRKRSLWKDAFIISLLGNVLSAGFLLIIPFSLAALLLSMAVWLLLIKRLYKTNWVGAAIVGILALLIFLGVTVLLASFFGILDRFLGRLVFSFVLIMR